MSRDDGAWDELDRELDAWGTAGQVATLWWRDDDATEPTAALDRLLDISGQHGAPVALAVIPAAAHRALAARLAAAPALTSVLQHGYAHRNHAPAGEKKAELSGHRPPAEVLGELEAGRARLAELFGATEVPALPVMVPPWNRIDRQVIIGLARAGYAGLSTYNTRRARFAGPGLLQVNTHADIVDWHGGRGFLGTAAALGLLTGHLAARRSGRADPEEPTGLITHHLVHDAACWAFCAELAERIAGHPSARWLDAAGIFNL